MFAFPSRPVFAVARTSRLGVVFATLCAVFLVAAFAAAPAAVAQDEDLFGDLLLSLQKQEPMSVDMPKC